MIRHCVIVAQYTTLVSRAMDTPTIMAMWNAAKK
jgi:hypothetical protein